MVQDATDQPDAALVAELNAGSGPALAALFDRHSDAIYTYCFRRTASWHAAEDATASVFLEVWRGRERVTASNGSALPWLYGVANNVCRNATRSAHRWLRAVSRVAAPPAEDDHADSVARRLDTERQMSRVLAAVRSLPQLEQDVLALVVWSGLSYQETADALGVPIGTVRSRLARARQRLAPTLDESTPATSASEDDHV